MKKLLFFLVFSFSFSQSNCELCVEQNGFYCGDDESNWTQYSPNGCVPNNWINDGWVDCVDSSDEGEDVVPTTALDCIPPTPICDTVFVDVPFYIYETIIQLDTVYQTEYITQIVVDTVLLETFIPEFIFITDTVYAEVLDTMYINVVDTLEITVLDIIIETEYIEFFITDTVVEYIDVVSTEYIDCLTGLPCGNIGIIEILKKSQNKNKIYNIEGKEIYRRKGLYIENGKINFKLK